MKKSSILSPIFLASALLTAASAMAAPPGGEHNVSAKLRKDTLPPTAVITAHHRTCQKDRKMRDIVVEAKATTDKIEGLEDGKMLELKIDYERSLTLLLESRDNVTREEFAKAVQDYMNKTNSIHIKFIQADIHFLPVAKASDPCATPTVK